ncbi:MAG: PEGA domain-containing protein, partial [Candidatus Desantisbacteria bacterium]
KSGSVVTFNSGESASSVLEEFTITNGSSTNGGGINCDHFSPTITNCTISNNSDSYGSGIFCHYSSCPTVVNSIFWDNIPQEICLDWHGDINITYSDIKGGYSGTGNLNADPLFAGEGSNCHLQSTSPCINVGSNTAIGTISTDLDGKTRIVNGVIDMGAYEFQGTSTPPVQYGTLPIISTPSGAKIYLDGNDTGSVTTHTFTNLSAGTHTIKLTLSGYQDWDGTATVTAGSITCVNTTLTQTEWWLQLDGGDVLNGGMACAYDSIRNCGVRFGGDDSNFNQNSDTYEWVGTETLWTFITSVGPSPRANSAAMASLIWAGLIVAAGLVPANR